ncbi:EndoU domain-containing protein [Pseudomonas helvetica]|uniref:EndoU domain-containing protein n=1 Tax=Pseudomonas helvetica TaxID=3136738 RepID=UPI003461516B
MFPEGWSDSQAISAIRSAGGTKPIATRVSDGASLYQSTVNGIKVEVVKVGDVVTAGYPCGKGCLTVQQFLGQ